MHDGHFGAPAGGCQGIFIYLFRANLKMYVLSQLDLTFGVLILMLQRATEILSRVKNEVSNKVIVDQLLKMIVRLLSAYFEGEAKVI